MNSFEKLVNDRMKEICKEQDKFVLQNLTFENLIELLKMITLEIGKRAEAATKETWEEANTYTIKKIKIEDTQCK